MPSGSRGEPINLVIIEANGHGKCPRPAKTRSGFPVSFELPLCHDWDTDEMLDQVGLSSSDAVPMFYKQITMLQGLPFEARIPDATTLGTLRNADSGRNLTRHADAID